MTERGRQEETERDYFSILGVSEDAGQDEIEARYRELSDHLASSAIPANLRDWADRQAELLDEAYAVLSDPDRRAELTEEPRHQTSVAADTAARRAAAEIPAEAAAVTEARTQEEELLPDEDEGSVSPFRALIAGVPWKLMGIGAAIGLVALGVIMFFPGGGDDDGSEATAQETGLEPIDTERVAELMELVGQDPKNTEATFELGEIYFLGGRWQEGIDWFTKLLKLDPTNVHALTDVGTANFNLGNYEAAKEAWLKAKELDPNDVQVHYNLGFLYANVEPLDYAAALGEWQSVVDLAPGSDLAGVAQVHLESLAAEAAGGESPAATGTPAPEQTAPAEEPAP
jgi:tetratricopeptide (TPR) repeat protein